MIAQGLKALKLMTGTAAMLMAVNVGTTSEAAAADEYLLPTNSLFVPQGFDDNDGVQVVLDGWVNSSCDHVLKPKVSIHPDYGVIEIEVRAVPAEMWCMPVLTRFTVVAELGVLGQGKYEVVTNNGWLVEPLIVEEAASGGPDDYKYAQVNEVFVDYAPDRAAATDSKWSAVIFGQYNNSCEKLDFVKVSDSGSTIEVLPVLKVEGEVCIPVQETFEQRVFLPDIQQEGRYLLHVRSANGLAVNHVFSAFQQ